MAGIILAVCKKAVAPSRNVALCSFTLVLNSTETNQSLKGVVTNKLILGLASFFGRNVTTV